MFKVTSSSAAASSPPQSVPAATAPSAKTSASSSASASTPPPSVPAAKAPSTKTSEQESLAADLNEVAAMNEKDAVEEEVRRFFEGTTDDEQAEGEEEAKGA